MSEQRSTKCPKCGTTELRDVMEAGLQYFLPGTCFDVYECRRREYNAYRVEDIRAMIAPLRALLAEARLQEQVDELQAEATKRLEASLPRAVRAFHARYGHPIRSTPAVPSDDEVRFRLRLIAEEFFELLDAALDARRDNGPGPSETSHAKGVFHMINTAPFLPEVDLPEFIDALGDLDYVVEGTRAVFGVDGTPVLAEIQRANMSKDPNGPDGKPVKPKSWKPPDIARVLEEQGWRR